MTRANGKLLLILGMAVIMVLPQFAMADVIGSSSTSTIVTPSQGQQFTFSFFLPMPVIVTTTHGVSFDCNSILDSISFSWTFNVKLWDNPANGQGQPTLNLPISASGGDQDFPHDETLRWEHSATLLNPVLLPPGEYLVRSFSVLAIAGMDPKQNAPNGTIFTVAYTYW